jgi:AmiR/NasT family two-component response regulator
MEDVLRPLDVRVVASATLAAHVPDLVDRLRPDLVIVGVATGAASEATALIRAVRANVRDGVVAVGDLDDRSVASSVLAAGAIAFVRRLRRV